MRSMLVPMRARWFALGALAILGTFYLYARLLIVLQTWPTHSAFIGFALAGLLGGATMARHALIVPWREPIGAALVAVAIVIGFWAIEPRDIGRLTDSMPGALLGIALVVCFSVAGAAIARRIFGTAPTRVASALLNVQLVGGILIILLAFMQIIHARSLAFMVPVLLGVALGGFLTQAVVPVRSVWACSAGSVVLALIMLSGTAPTFQIVVGFLVLWLVGALGAAFAWRVLPPPATTADVPSARLQ